MRLIRFAALLALVCAFVSGCRATDELENQAYVLVLGIERLPDGQLGMTARVPKIGKSKAPQGDESTPDSPYLTFSVSGRSWNMALEALQHATPRKINLSHIVMLVVSRPLASEADHPELMNEIAQTPHLYTNAKYIVCEGSARAFVEAGETIIGTRMSSELNTMLEQYAEQGYIPGTCFAEAAYASNSCYADPVATLAYIAEEPGTGDAGDATVLESPMKQRFSGAALFRDGICRDVLDSGETRLLNMITGRSKDIIFESGGTAFDLSKVRRITKRVQIEPGAVRVVLSMRLAAKGDPDEAAINALEGNLKSTIAALIRKCQGVGCDPFGFAEAAVRQFGTVDQWLAFDWKNQFSKAAADVRVSVTRGGGQAQ